MQARAHDLEMVSETISDFTRPEISPAEVDTAKPEILPFCHQDAVGQMASRPLPLPEAVSTPKPLIAATPISGWSTESWLSRRSNR